MKDSINTDLEVLSSPGYVMGEDPVYQEIKREQRERDRQLEAERAEYHRRLQTTAVYLVAGCGIFLIFIVATAVVFKILTSKTETQTNYATTEIINCFRG